ncbi:MAG: hypothetical protein AAGJ70_05820, partial [Pseudomonadota bacterium]
LHLLGHDHVDDDGATEMELIEVDVLASLGIDDPYGDLEPGATRAPDLRTAPTSPDETAGAA